MSIAAAAIAEASIARGAAADTGSKVPPKRRTIAAAEPALSPEAR